MVDTYPLSLLYQNLGKHYLTYPADASKIDQIFSSSVLFNSLKTHLRDGHPLSDFLQTIDQGDSYIGAGTASSGD